MCGIFGVHDPRGADLAALRRMAAALVHRGPDDEGILCEGPIGLGNRRLEIIDVASGHQPIANEDGTVHVVQNGEIYNHVELRRRLEETGHRFRTRSDTEVIVHLYEELGIDFVRELDGMFAVALWDAPRSRLVLARDRLGQKPLFFARDGQRLLFASEAKALLAAAPLPREVDWEAVHHSLALRFVPSPRTLLTAVEKLPPAHVLVREDGTVSTRRYWRLSFLPKLDVSGDELLAELRAAMAASVRSHLVSDVPVGAFLSGGLDSSTIVALRAQGSPAPFDTFAIGVREADFDELPHARRVARHLGLRLRERVVDADLVGLLPLLVHHLEEPSDPIALCLWHASRLASEHVKVALGGDGGDELFAGFDRYLGVLRLGALAALPSWLRQGVIARLARALPDGFGYKTFAQKVQWACHVASAPTVASRYAEATCFFRFHHDQQHELYEEPLRRRLAGVRAADVIAGACSEADAEDPLDRMLHADYVTRLPEHTLMLTDRLGMAHGLETRSPFLDHRLVELLARVPAAEKVRGGRTKDLLRRLVARDLPEDVVRRPKQGFMLPVARWLRGPLLPFARRSLGDSRLVAEGHFRKQPIARMLDEHARGRVDHHVRLWMLLALDTWFRLTIDGEGVDALRERFLAQAAPRAGR